VLVCSADVLFLIAVRGLRVQALVLVMGHVPARPVATTPRVPVVLAAHLAAVPCIPRVPARPAPLVHGLALGRRVPVVPVDGLGSAHALEWVDLRVPAA
jgi:hypothetical protein